MSIPESWEVFVSDKTTAPEIREDHMKTMLVHLERTEIQAPQVTAEQMDLIRRTVAKDATPDELKLYLFDCARQGVHPLDKLIHFTKRSGKYTPVTSIDFMRIRAADSGEYAGSDDAVYGDSEGLPEHPVKATVTVWRMVQGQRCSFTATARWAEYKPEQAFMWNKMPFLMLGKCAEALALRKGFPKQLAGLYAKEEMDQAEDGARAAGTGRTRGAAARPKDTPVESVADSPQPKPNVAPETIPVPEGYTQVVSYELDNYGWHHAILSRPAGIEVKTKQAVGQLLRTAFDRQIPAKVSFNEKSYVTGVKLYDVPAADDETPF